MIDPIKHFALTSLPTVHDEEAMTSLELMGRIGAKMNQVVETVNENDKTLTETIESLPSEIYDAVEHATGEEFKKINDKVNAAIEKMGESTSNIRPGTVANGSIYSGMLGTDMLELRQNHYVVMAGKWSQELGYINDELQLETHSGYNISEMIPVKYGQYYKITTAIFGNQVYPVALYDVNGTIVEVRGEPGKSEWNMVTHEIAIDRGDVAFMRVLCGTSYTAQMRVEYYTLKDFSINNINLATEEHWHMHAMKRTDTVTDRAQIKCWFKLPADHSDGDKYHLSFNMAKYNNIAAEGITLRLFMATNAESYSTQLNSGSAAGYSFLRSRTLDVHNMMMPSSAGSLTFTHLCLFMDFIPEDGDQFMDVWMLPPVLERTRDGLKISPIDPQCHGGLNTDTVSIVRPGAAMFGTYRKKIIGIGDSLMSGNTLPKMRSWFNLAAGALDMDHRNVAVNGMPIANPPDGSDSMQKKIGEWLTEFGKPDYAIVQGGANDKRLNVTVDAFKAGLRVVLDAILTKNSRCKILLASNWRRTASANTAGHTDDEYVTAMAEVAEEYSIPFINNYTEGLNLMNTRISAWADEGKVSTGTADIHFSIEANKWTADKYIATLAAL